MKKIALIGVALVGILFVCLVLGAILLPKPEEGSFLVNPAGDTEFYVGGAYDEPTPTFGVAATLEELLATSTPRPTNTPEPIMDLFEFTLYLEAIEPATDVLADEAFGLADQFGEVGDDPLVMFSDSWITKTARHFVRMDQAADTLVNTDAPVIQDWPIIQEIETVFKCAGRETQQAIDDLIYGIDNILPDYLEKGITHMELSTVCADRASELLDEFNEMVGK